MNLDAGESVKGRFIIFDFVVSALATILNTIVLFGVIKAKVTLKGYKSFLISLILSDMYASLINIGSYSVQVTGVPGWREMAPETAESLKHCWVQFFRSLQIVSFSINIFTLCGMSIDHYIGILYPFRYHRIMRQRNIYITIVSIWIFSFAFGFSDYAIAQIIEMKSEANQRKTFSDLITTKNQQRCGDAAAAADLASGQDSSASIDLPDDVLDALSNLLSNHSSSSSQQSAEGLLMQSIPLFGSAVANSEKNKSSSGEAYSCQIQAAIMQFYHDGADVAGASIGHSCIFSSNGNNIWLESAVMTLAGVCFFFLLFCYSRIFLEVFFEQKLPQRSVRRLIVTTVLLLGAFFLSWMPVLIFELAMLIVATKNLGAAYSKLLVVHTVLNSFMFAYPLIDPLIYAARLSSVRKAILQNLNHIFPKCLHKHAIRLPSIMVTDGLLSPGGGEDPYRMTKHRLPNSAWQKAYVPAINDIPLIDDDESA